MMSQSRFQAVLLFGAPGSGKGTQGKAVGMLPGYAHMAMGDIFRAMDRNSELGKIFVQYSSRGELVPDDFTVRLWKEYADKQVAAGKFNPESDTLILDGIPRNVKQCKMMEPFIEVKQLVVLSCERDRESIIERLKARALKENRLDDAKEETVRRRMDVYDRDTAPVVAYYPAQLRVNVDALQKPLEVAHDVISAILGRHQELRRIG
jgi:adenylate kinase